MNDPGRYKNWTRASRSGITLRRGYLSMCELDSGGSSRDSLYVFAGAFNKLNERVGVIGG